ncbi:MAG: glycyl-radical enzyme activating protein [Longicatena sp.]
MIQVCNIERFATHDGEGIRSVIFFQGCPLRCPWCANPESQEMYTQLLYDQKKCVLCHTCERSCQQNAISFRNDQFHWDKTRCIACKTCEDECLQEAISFVGKAMSVEDIMVEIRKDRAYYEASNGGVSISGGEAFMQFDALMELLKVCKSEGYNVCMETCGQVSLEHLKEASPYIDTYYFDVKHVDEKKYQEVVKGNLEIVQYNLNYLTQKYHEKVVFRIPVIPGFNYEEKVLCAILDLAKDKKVKEVHFLPYHTLGKIKYDKLLREYPYTQQMLNEKDLFKYVKIAQEKGICLKIGG